MAYKNLSYNTAHEIIRKEEKISKYGERYVREEEESEDEERGDSDFPALRRNRKKIEYWENLPIPIEKERGKWNGTWGRNREKMTYGREEKRYRNEQLFSRERSFEQQGERYGYDGDRESMKLQNKKSTNEEVQQKDYITEQIKKFQHEDRRRDNNKGVYQEKYRKREDRTGSQDNVSGRHKTERDDGWTQQQGKRIYNKESTKYNQMEGRERRKGSEIGREGEINNNNDDNMGVLKNKGEDNLIEEIVKIIKDKNILAKVMKKLADDQRESKKEETRELIEEEDDWNTPCIRTTENNQRDTGKAKVKLINKCFTEEREIISEEEESREVLRRKKKEREIEEEKQEGEKERKKQETKMREVKFEKIKEPLIQKKEIENKEEEDNLDGKSISEIEDWKSVTTDNENESLGTVEWLEDKEIEQEQRMSETDKENEIREKEELLEEEEEEEKLYKSIEAEEQEKIIEEQQQD